MRRPGLLAAVATFAVGCFVRPLGGVVIAHIGDRFGRKPALVLTIMLIRLAAVLMGMLPTYASVGIMAPVLLVLMRLLKGFGAGAELAGAIVLAAEDAPPGRMLAALFFLTISNLPEPVLLGWAWRVPFLLSGVLFLVALYIRGILTRRPNTSRRWRGMRRGAMRRRRPASCSATAHEKCRSAS